VSVSNGRKRAVLMAAYTYYESDTRVIREAEAAVDGGFDVDFIALRRPDAPAEEVIRGVHLIRVKQSKYRGKSHFRYLIEYLKFFFSCFAEMTVRYFDRRYAVIHVNNMPDFLVFSTIVPKLLGAKIILDIHDPMPNTFASKFKGAEGGFFYSLLLLQERLSAAYCDQVITVHDPVKDGILSKHGLRPDSIQVIANFADEDLFPLRKTFSVDGKIRCVFHGTILERSGLRTLMNALAQVRQKNRISVCIIGEGDFSTVLGGLIESLQLSSMVEFDNHSYPARSIPARIMDCNVGLVPLEISSVTNYALPLKLFEYISLGLPVVSVRSDAISYYFSEKDCIFFDWNDPGSLSKVLDRIAENPEILYGYRERSVALRERFSWAVEKDKYVTLLHHLIGTA
jgi:glycosyltransferase involved in cell wall biosynthesis